MAKTGTHKNNKKTARDVGEIYFFALQNCKLAFWLHTVLCVPSIGVYLVYSFIKT